jgi:hypothetical protein
VANTSVLSRSQTLLEQLQIWQARWSEAQRQMPSQDEALVLFAETTEPKWSQERVYYLELQKLARSLGAETLDIRNDGAIDTPEEFARAMVQLVKRLTDDNYVALGQNPTARQVEGQNDEDIEPAKLEAEPDNVLSPEEQEALLEAKRMFGADKDFSNLFQHIARAQAEGFSGEAATAYLAAQIEFDTINSGRGGDAAFAQQMLKRAQELSSPERPRTPFVPPVPADTQ